MLRRRPKASRSATYLSAWRIFKGNPARVLSWTDITRGGVIVVVPEKASKELPVAMLCLHCKSLLTLAKSSPDCIAEYMYERSLRGSRSAALTTKGNKSADTPRNAFAKAGVVDQTKLAYGPGSGKTAIGPVGRNLCQAVSFACVGSSSSVANDSMRVVVPASTFDLCK